jgi:hypothetical protein
MASGNTQNRVYNGNESDPQLAPLHLKLKVYLNSIEFGEKATGLEAQS